MKTKYDLDSRSLSLAVTICLGVTQNQTLLDHYIDLYSKAGSKIEPKVRDIMRSAAYQLVFMDKIPASAAVNEAVMQCKALGFSRASGFCNAVLRRIAEAKDNLPPIPYEGMAKHLSIKYSHPEWLSEYIVKLRGYEAAEAFFAANNSVPETCIQVNTLKTQTSEFYDRLVSSGYECVLHPWLPDCIITSGNVTAMTGFDEGCFYVQDPAAKCAVLCAGIEPGMEVLDACAAPGGKSFAAAIAMNNRGSILSRDLHEKKLGLISAGARRLGIDIISVQAGDAREHCGRQYDAVIADVPCSGYGVIRKKPEIRYKKENERLGLPSIQYAILSNLADAVRPGGVLVYSTCTVMHEENEDVVFRFISEHPEFSLEGFTLPTGENVDGGYITFWPDIHGTDGFFAARLRRNK